MAFCCIALVVALSPLLLCCEHAMAFGVYFLRFRVTKKCRVLGMFFFVSTSQPEAHLLFSLEGTQTLESVARSASSPPFYLVCPADEVGGMIFFPGECTAVVIILKKAHLSLVQIQFSFARCIFGLIRSGAAPPLLYFVSCSFFLLLFSRPTHEEYNRVFERICCI